MGPPVKARAHLATTPPRGRAGTAAFSGTKSNFYLKEQGLPNTHCPWGSSDGTVSFQRGVEGPWGVGGLLGPLPEVLSMAESTEKLAQKASAPLKGHACRLPRLGLTSGKVAGLTTAQRLGSTRREERPGKLHLPLPECLPRGHGDPGARTATCTSPCSSGGMTKLEDMSEELRPIPSTQSKYPISVSSYYFLKPMVSSEGARQNALGKHGYLLAHSQDTKRMS